MKYIESNSTDPYFNLALEEYVFESLPKDDKKTINLSGSRMQYTEKTADPVTVRFSGRI